MNGAAELLSIKTKKGAAMQCFPGVGRNQMVAFPSGVFPMEHLQDILPVLLFPADDVLLGHISREIRQAASPAPHAFGEGFIV